MIINKKLNKVINNTDSESEALLDLTGDTVAPENLLLNKTAHNRDGEGILGTMNEGGTSDYDELQNRPSINSHTLTGNKTGSQLGLQNRVLASTLNIGGQTIGSVEGALSALNESKSDLVNGKVPVNELPVYTPVIGSIQSIGGIVPPSSSGDEDKYLRSDGTWAKPAGGGGGVSNYDDLTNRPKVNGTTLSGDKTGTQLGLQNIILSSTLSIGGQTVTEVEEALGSLANISKSMTGATSSTAGKGGFVPSPSAGDENKALFGDGTWKPVSGGGGHTILDEDGITYPQRSKLQFEGCEVTDDAVNGITVVKCEGGETVIVDVPTVTNTELIYDGTAKSPTITRDTAHTTVTGTTEATELGSYTFTISLSKRFCVWSDGTIAPKTYTWSVGYDGSTITPVNDIQTWLKCAMITDKTYTTIAQVLADATTLSALMLSNNAVDYLVRSTSWVSDITGNQTAMTDIGASDYCADTLLANSTWRTAICDSAYFESVLNVKVPVMTSNTTPSGEAIGETQFDARTWFYAFNPQYVNLIFSSPWWVGYDFITPVSVKKVMFQARTDETDPSILLAFMAYIEASNDKNTWTKIAERNITAQEHISSLTNPIYINIDNANSYRYYRMRTGSYNYNYNNLSNCGNLQFYGRASS